MAKAKNTRRRDSPHDVAAEMKMIEWAHKAKAFHEAGKVAQARTALKKAEEWRRKAGF
jgi:hypothetical protein